MFFDTRRHLGKEQVALPSEYICVRPGRFVWADGYCFVEGEPKVGGDLAQAISDVLEHQDDLSGLSSLNGSYAAVIVSIERGEIEVVSDRLGTRPV